MLKYVPMTSENVFDVVITQMEIFPSECGYFQYNYLDYSLRLSILYKNNMLFRQVIFQYH